MRFDDCQQDTEVLTSPSFRTGGSGGSDLRYMEAMPSTHNPNRYTLVLSINTQSGRKTLLPLNPSVRAQREICVFVCCTVQLSHALIGLACLMLYAAIVVRLCLL